MEEVVVHLVATNKLYRKSVYINPSGTSFDRTNQSISVQIRKPLDIVCEFSVVEDRQFDPISMPMRRIVRTQ